MVLPNQKIRKEKITAVMIMVTEMLFTPPQLLPSYKDYVTMMDPTMTPEPSCGSAPEGLYDDNGF